MSLIPHLQELVQEAASELAGVVRRRVLVSDGWFVRDRMFALVSRQARIVVRLTEPAAQTELLALEGASLWTIKNRKPMRDWIQLPEELHDDREAVALWVKRAWSDAQSQAKLAKRKPATAKKEPLVKKTASRRRVR